MEESIIEYIKGYNKKMGWPEIQSDTDILEILQGVKQVHKEVTNERRWWNDTVIVVKLEDKYIQYGYADNTGDSSLNDLGWEFHIGTVIEVKPVEKVVTTTEYVPV